MKKFFSYLASATVILTSSSAIALNANNSFTGPYAGVNYGYGLGTGKYVSTLITPPNGRTSSAADYSLRGVRGGLHIGYGKLFPMKSYLGLEATADYSNTITKIPAGTFKLRRQDAYGLALRFGGILGAGMLGYGKVGVETSRWKSTGTHAFTLLNIVPSKNVKRTNGLVLGIGMEMMVTKHIMLGSEWAYTVYRNATNLTYTNPNVRGNFQNTVYKPRTSDIRLRASYKW